jgi:hypothetical protein
VEVQNKFESSRLIWFGQVKIMGEHGIPKIIPEMIMSGIRPRGRPIT